MYHGDNDMEFELSQEERIAAELEDEREQALKIQLRQDERLRRQSSEPKDPPKKKKLKRELRREALTRLEEAARTQNEFNEVVAWWDKLDENRERRERDHEVCVEMCRWSTALCRREPSFRLLFAVLFGGSFAADTSSISSLTVPMRCTNCWRTIFSQR